MSGSIVLVTISWQAIKFACKEWEKSALAVPNKGCSVSLEPKKGVRYNQNLGVNFQFLFQKLKNT